MNIQKKIQTNMQMSSIIMLAFVIAITALVVSCSNKKDNWGVHYKNQNAGSDTISPTPETTPTALPSPTPIVTVTPSVTPSPTPNPESVQSEVYKGKDGGIAKSPESKQRSWFVELNDTHKPPNIPQNIQKITSNNNAYYLGDTSQKVIYLTFDEGYENGSTARILDVLKEKNQKATFFITGGYMKNSKSLIARMLSEGHGLGNHSMNHSNISTLSESKLKYEIDELKKECKDAFGVDTVYFRPPTGDYSETALSEINKLGYKTIFWSFGYDDFDTKKQKGPEYAYNKIMKYLHNGEILLLHAVSKDNTEILGKLIDDIRSQGYVLSPLNF